MSRRSIIGGATIDRRRAGFLHLIVLIAAAKLVASNPVLEKTAEKRKAGVGRTAFGLRLAISVGEGMPAKATFRRTIITPHHRARDALLVVQNSALQHAARTRTLVGGVAEVAARASVPIVVAVSTAPMTWPQERGHIRDEWSVRLVACCCHRAVGRWEVWEAFAEF